MALTNSQYDEISRGFESRRLRHERDFREKLNKAYEEFPRLEEIDKEMAALSLKKTRIALNMSSASDFDLGAAITELSAEKKALLSAAGFKGGIAEPEYDCPICHDTGIADGNVCSCFRQAGIKLIYAQSRLENVLGSENFDTFDLSLYSDDMINPDNKLSARETAKRAKNFALQYVESFEQKHGNIFLYGKTGVGKTFLSNCIAKALLDKGVSVLYLTAFDLFRIFEEDTFRHTEETKENSGLIFESDLLIIDDLGTNVNNSFISSQLFHCINERLLTNRSTIISTNQSISELQDAYTDRVTSRISSCYTFLNLFGDDIRQKKLFSQDSVKGAQNV